MKCPGDGAQPEFEVALFRYRDSARAGLLALCSGELEGADAVQLQFFELGADGKMQLVRQPILPGADSKKDPQMWYVKEGRKFELPPTGKTIRVRAQKSGKILHKFTWNSEKFVEQK